MINRKISNGVVLAFALCVFFAPHFQNTAISQQVVNEFTILPAGEIVEDLSLDIPGQRCLDWMGKPKGRSFPNGWKENKNQKPDGSHFFVAMGDAKISAPVGHPNYISSRENAFDKAFLKAKGAMVEYRAQSIAQETKLMIMEGEFSRPESSKKTATPDPANPEKDEGMSGAFAKTLKLIHDELDKELQTRGIDQKGAKKVPEKVIEKEIDKILNQENFKKLTETVAKGQVKGARRMYVSESAKPGEKGSICVVMLHSPKFEQLADALLARDVSMVPRMAPGRPIEEWLPHPKKGVRQLMNSYGIETHRNEKGLLVVVSFSQAGARNKNAVGSAISIASKRATGNLRAFISEQMNVKTKTENSENAKELENNMSSYLGGDAQMAQWSSRSKPFKITGVSVLFRWAAKHPTTSQIIGGAVVTWSPDDMQFGERLDSSANSLPVRNNSRQTNGQSREKRFSTQDYNRRQGGGGEREGGTSEQDF